jgi:hypothetical protein
VIRLGFVISLLTLFTLTGGWPGLFCAVIVLGALGVCFPPRARAELRPADPQDKRWERCEPARKGREADPTRPSDEHPMLLTNEVRRRR